MVDMPTLKLCIDCNTLTNTRRCTTCQHAYDQRQATYLERAERQAADKRRGTSTQRGYDWTWRTMSARLIKQHPWCTHCGHDGTMSNPLTTDHIIPKAQGGTDKLSNLQVLCRRCNSAKG